MQTFYINLARRADRNLLMQSQFAKLGMEVERIEATTPETAPPELIATYCDMKQSRWITPIELACALSHRQIWNAIIDRSLPGALVLEDDVILSPSLPNVLAGNLEAVEQADIIRIQTTLGPTALKPAIGQLAASIQLHRLFTVQWCTGGYFISAAGARKLLASDQLFRFPLDDLLFNPAHSLFRELNISQAVPALVIAAGLVPKHAGGSVLESDIAVPEWRQLQRGTTGWAKAWLFLKRLRREFASSARHDIAVHLRGARATVIPFADT